MFDLSSERKVMFDLLPKRQVIFDLLLIVPNAIVLIEKSLPNITF